MPEHIERIRIRGYGCIKDLEFEPGMLSVFVGPNDSGKSTILRAIQTLLRSLQGDREHDFASELHRDGSLVLGASGLRFAVERPGVLEEWFVMGEQSGGRQTRPEGAPRERSDDEDAARAAFGWLFAPPGAVLVRLDADSLREPSPLIPDGEEFQSFSERGAGLAGVCDAIQNRGDGTFEKISDEVRRLFPTVTRLGLRNVVGARGGTTLKQLQVTLSDGTQVAAERLSEGLLYYLAFAALRSLTSPVALLIEEPENGLHPARVAEVVGVLREISKHTQVFIATHSPLVVNEVPASQVFVTTRDVEHGTQLCRLDKTTNFEKRAAVYEPGELWLAYADGESESALVGEKKQ